DRTEAGQHVGDAFERGPIRVTHLIDAHRYEAALDQRREQLHRSAQLRAASVIQYRLVALHARAAAASQHQSVKRGTHDALRRRPTMRRPPLLLSRRTLV